MIVSALMWQKHNGSIKLYTDKAGYEFISRNNLLDLWDSGINTDILENTNYPINPTVFWAAGKLIALEASATPCVMLDTDLIVLKSLTGLLHDSVLTALHPESLEPNVYLSPELLKKAVGFTFPDNYNWDVSPANTAFLFIRDLEFRQFYVDESKKFMFHNDEMPAEMVSQMVFAEQRLLSICADYAKIPLNFLLSEPFSSANSQIIHLWGFKELMRKSEAIQKMYAQQLYVKIAHELAGIPVFDRFVDYVYPDFL